MMNNIQPNQTSKFLNLRNFYIHTNTHGKKKYIFNFSLIFNIFHCLRKGTDFFFPALIRTTKLMKNMKLREILKREKKWKSTLWRSYSTFYKNIDRNPLARKCRMKIINILSYLCIGFWSKMENSFTVYYSMFLLPSLNRMVKIQALS